MNYLSNYQRTFYHCIKQFCPSNLFSTLIQFLLLSRNFSETFFSNNNINTFKQYSGYQLKPKIILFEDKRLIRTNTWLKDEEILDYFFQARILNDVDFLFIVKSLIYMLFQQTWWGKKYKRMRSRSNVNVRCQSICYGCQSSLESMIETVSFDCWPSLLSKRRYCLHLVYPSK